MSRWVRHSIAAALALAAAMPSPAGEAGDSERRARLGHERAAIEAQYRRDELECATRFAVTACVDDAKARRRGALRPLERERAALEDSERRRRASERLSRIEEKRRDAALRQPPDVKMAREPKEEASLLNPAPRAGRMVPPNANAQPGQARPGAAAAYERRQRDAEMHRATVQRRNGERARQRPPAAPLPDPPAGAAP